MKTPIRTDDALLVVDMQNDFLPGGSLAVPKSDEIIPIINEYIRLFTTSGIPIFASRDWHPQDHMSFLAQGGSWPPHCVADSNGAAFHSDLFLPPDTIIISKGTDRSREAYSALDGTQLCDMLKSANIQRVFVCGLATDYCVHATAKDLLAEGFPVVLLVDGMRGVEVNRGDTQKAMDDLLRTGGTETTLSQLII